MSRTRSTSDKLFYASLLSVALPVTLQNLIATSLNMIDTIMIGRLSEHHIAAVGLANQVFFLFVIALFGINSAASIFTAQFWGKRDIPRIHRTLGLALCSGILVGIVFALGAILIPRTILGIFTQDEIVITLGAEYLRIVAFSYLFTAISFAYGFATRSIGQPTLPLVVSGVSLLLNTGLNYVLIFGKLGMPIMGIRGAALATLIARTIEAVMFIFLLHYRQTSFRASLRSYLCWTKEFVKKYLKTTSHVTVDEALWSVGIVLCTVAYARMGTNAITSVQISNTISNIFMVIATGLGHACAVMIGNKLGASEFDDASNYAKKFCLVGPLIGIGLGLILAVSAPAILSVFKVSASVRNDTLRILYVMGAFFAVRILNTILIIGILRSGGDTKYTLFVQTGTIWIIGVPLAFLGAMYWQLGIHWVVLLASSEEIVKCLLSLGRYASRKWVNNIVAAM